MAEEIIIGSGTLYYSEFSGAIPADATLEVIANRLGLIKGGASVSYNPTFQEDSDDLGLVKVSTLTKEEVTLKTGVMTNITDTLSVLSPTARAIEDTENDKTIIKIGGIANDNGKKYIIRFVHKSGDIAVTIVGRNQTGFELAFKLDGGTVIDAEFKAFPCDDEGTLVIYEERNVA